MSHLDNINKKSPFKVPENYFETFNADIMSKLPQKEESKKIVPLWKKVVPWVSIAAVCVGVLFSVNIFDKDSPLTNKKDVATQQGTNQNVNDATLASSQEAEDFLLFLQDEALQASYYETFNVE